MVSSRAERLDRERRRAEWEANEERVKARGNLFSALPEGPQKESMKDSMTDRIVDLYNNCKWEEGDAILEFLPNDWARQLLDWYFDDNGKIPHPAKAAAIENEDPQQGQVQSEPQIPERTHG